MPGELHRSIPVDALPTDAQGGHHQGAGTEESDDQEEKQNARAFDEKVESIVDSHDGTNQIQRPHW